MDEGMKQDMELAENQAKIKSLNEYSQRVWKEIARTDRKEFAALNDISLSYAGEILNTNNEGNSKPFQEKMIPSLMIVNPNLFKTLYLDFALDVLGYDPARTKRKLLPAEELSRIKKRIAEHKLTPLFQDIK